MQGIRVNVNDAAGQLVIYGAGAKVHLERGTTSTGPFTEVDDQVIVANRDQYVFPDPDGNTASWYRSYLTKADDTSPSEYSAAFQPATPLAYASIEDLAELLPRTSGTRNNNLLSDILVRATAFMTARCKRDFFRHPTTGTETQLYDVSAGTRLLRIPGGLVSVSLVEYATATGGAFTALPADAWILGESVPGSGFYDRIVLTDISPILAFYPGRGVLRLTKVGGYAGIPDIIQSGTLALARLMYATEATPNGQPKAQPTLDQNLPLETVTAIEWATGQVTAAGAKARGIRSVRMSTAPVWPGWPQ